MSSKAPAAASSSVVLPSRPGLVVIGNFDGVHRGHFHVLTRAAELAARRDLALKVLTFHPHPREVVTGQVVSVLTDIDRKRRLLAQLGLGIETVVFPFTSQTAQLSPDDFVREILFERLAAHMVMVGQGFRFGRGRSGDLDALSTIGRTFGIEVWAEALQGDDQGVFSSTRVRNYLSDGDVEGAASVLGRPHLISGFVARGDQRGRTLGFPTANLEQVPQVLPQDGVYAGSVYDLSNGASYLGPGALNLGARPTVDRPHAVEVHVLGYEGELYGRKLAVDLRKRVRPVMRFEGVEALKEQITRDVATTAELLAEIHAPQAAPGF